MIRDTSIEKNHLILPPLLDEFCKALQDEIQVAKRNVANTSVPLNNGQQIGQQGGAYQYAFIIDTVLNTPDGTPCELILPGRPPMEVTIVSTEGLRIVVSVESNLGQFVPSAYLQTDLTILMRKLIERIEQNATRENAAASRMLGTTKVDGTPQNILTKTDLYPDQIKALESALGRNLTFIWGPPGTGKTYAIGTITEHLYRAGRSVLIVSHTNTAVDQAIKHVAKSMENHLEQGAVIRIGEVKDEVLRIKYPDVLLTRQVERHSKELIQRQEQLIAEKQKTLDKLDELNKKISIINWLIVIDPNFIFEKEKLQKIHELEKIISVDKKHLSEIQVQHQNILELYKKTSRILELRRKLEKQREIQDSLDKEDSGIDLQIKNIGEQLQEQNSRIETAKRISTPRKERATYPNSNVQEEIIENLSAKIAEFEKSLEDTKHRHSLAKDVLSQIYKSNNFIRILKRLPKSEDQEKIVNELKNRIEVIEMERNATKVALENAGNKLSRIIELDAELIRYEDIGTETEEKEKQIELRKKLKIHEDKKLRLDESLKSLFEEVLTLEDEENQLVTGINGDVNKINQEVRVKIEKMNNLERDIKSNSSSVTLPRN